MKKYLVQYDGNYADEFDVYFHTVMSEDELQETIEAIVATDWHREEFYFGTNESIEVYTEELIQHLNNAVEITEEEHQILVKLGIDKIGFGDGLNWDWIVERAEEDNEE